MSLLYSTGQSSYIQPDSKGKNIIPTFEGKIVKKTVAIIRICTGWGQIGSSFKNQQNMLLLYVEEMKDKNHEETQSKVRWPFLQHSSIMTESTHISENFESWIVQEIQKEEILVKMKITPKRFISRCYLCKMLVKVLQKTHQKAYVKSK